MEYSIFSYGSNKPSVDQMSQLLSTFSSTIPRLLNINNFRGITSSSSSSDDSTLPNLHRDTGTLLNNNRQTGKLRLWDKCDLSAVTGISNINIIKVAGY